MGQIIQICKRFLFYLGITSIIHIFFTERLIANEYGNYLSWGYARESGDNENLKSFFDGLNFSKLNTELLEEALFESVLFSEWEKARDLSSLIKKDNNKNSSANLLILVDNFLNKKEVSKNIENIDLRFFDINFLKSIIIWTNQNDDFKFSDSENCVPIICLHSGMKLMTKGKKNEAIKYFDELLEQNIQSTRIKEILFLAYVNVKNFSTSAEIFGKLSLKDLNNKSYEMNYFEKNNYLLNPVKTNREGLAETFYNISSWYYQKNLFKYSVFFGKLSLRLRPNFNAMKLLLINSLENLDYPKLAVDITNNLNLRDPYFLRFIKIKSSLYDKLNDKESFITNLQNLSQNYPKNWELKLILADKLRSLKRYEDSILLYNDVINNELLKDKWPVFYSRGIAFERLNNWESAEKDLKRALELNPNDPYVLNYLAYSWLDRNINIKKALNYLIKAVEIEPTDGYIIDSLGWAYYLSGIYDMSVYYLEKAVSIMPSDATLNDHLGDAYWKSERKKEAISQWKKILIIDPEFKNIETVKKKIKKGLK